MGCAVGGDAVLSGGDDAGLCCVQPEQVTECVTKSRSVALKKRGGSVAGLGEQEHV